VKGTPSPAHQPACGRAHADRPQRGAGFAAYGVRLLRRLWDRARRHPLVTLWLIALAASTAVRWAAPGRDGPTHGTRSVEVRAVDGDRLLATPVRLAFADFGDASSQRPVVLLLHGSPGWHQDLSPVARLLAPRARALVPDLPGFGGSTRDVPDYSIRAHARYALELLDALGVERAHLVGFSMGSGVAIEIAGMAPERVASLTMLSGIGVQEHELLGDYHLNHALHWLQLALVEVARTLVPHFGALDGWLLPYARNFYDSDQRPLRATLEHIEAPALILHGEQDALVPPAAALEHHRLLPQSRLEMHPTGHFLLFTHGDQIARAIGRFVDDVERGVLPTRSSLAPQARALREGDPTLVATRAAGIGLAILMAILAASTLVSEDLTCIAAGLLVAQGRIGFASATFACFAGIYIGDLLLFLAGRALGRPALGRWPLSRLVSREAVERSSAWLAQNGATVIALSRFMPGTRLPTYVAAGLLETRASTFAAYFFVAAALWTPALVALSMWAGDGANVWLAGTGKSTIALTSAMAIGILVVLRTGLPLVTWRGRRLAVGRWRRLTRWEFWPLPVFYVPIALWIAWLAVRHRSLTLATAANPAIPGGGFAGESKIDILRGLADSPEHALPCALVPAALSETERLDRARELIARAGLRYPVVLKPDVGERGAGVSFPRSEEELGAQLAAATDDMLVQEYVPGCEFGIFYYRFPDDERGRILSLTEKVLPVVRGDGRRTLEELILADERAVCMAHRHLARLASRLTEVPAAGDEIRLVDVGTHSRGAVFLDGRRLASPALEDAVDRVSRRFPGFYFGRYDVRVRDGESLAAGRGFKIVELNGITSEATHIYDPGSRLIDAYRVLFEQWRIAFEIGRQNRARGARPASLRELARLVRGARARRG
jgi:pimeloyl-ACP methyl ester carboxylesterase/membrane protein DedA with SNARE-associated domain